MAPPAEISIPSTIVSTAESKPFTLYNITLRLPSAPLTSQVGAPPPTPLPSKSWLKSTISSPELTELRRQGLEAYLRAIAESPIDGGEIRQPGMIGTAAVGAADPTMWLDMHREMKACLHSAQSHLTKRDGAYDAHNTSTAAEAGAAAKRELVKAGTLLASLSDGLRTIQESSRLGDGEVRRRRDLLGAARVERDGLERLSNTISPSQTAMRSGGRDGPSWGGDKASLLSGASTSSSSRSATRPGGRVIGAPLPETDQTRELDNTQLLSLQKRVLTEQDQNVDQLTAIVRRQKEIGLAIKDEVDRQTEMLDMMNDDVDRVGNKIKVAKNRTRNL
ncbi:unnamed protein product [Parascedosporium putredinis]|uniref:t-SNARE coiled-coil homology domain-containing protein n=1 Tax=Parascedosporium putredinis TaxID=1442378 RepID=A0A9P1MES1_9PEZI|nr:unnamed protein product [Parascedosporium putredinis]CAI8001058.1 unnamed protein product [Parascedosporium putredinis]